MQKKDFKRPILCANGIPCPHCHAVIDPERKHFAAYFTKGGTSCPYCAKDVDWWKMAFEEVEMWPPDWTAFALLGTKRTIARLPLAPGASTDVDLHALGIPAEAEVLNAEFLTLVDDLDQPSTWPAVMAGQVLRFDPFPRKFAFYGTDFGKKTLPCEVQLTVTWLAPGPDQLPLHYLADAGKAFAAGRYAGVIVPANIAVESSLAPALLAWIRTFCPKEAAESFLSDGATYSHQLKVLTRLASGALGIPEVPSRIRNILDKLRAYRNDMVHKGVLDHPKRPPPSKKDAAEFLVAAVFGYRYAQFFEAEIDKRWRPMAQPE